MLLKNGSTGPQVGIIQNNLKMLGYDPLIIDCIFGRDTENIVKKFQSSYDLAADGIVGDDPWSKLIYEIKDIQTALNNPGHNLIVYGICGPATRSNLFSDQIANIATNFDSCNNSNSNKFDISESGINFIANYEDFYPTPYRGLDSPNQTIGYGHVITLGKNFESLTEEEAKALLTKDLQSFVYLVNNMITGIELTQWQFDFLISFSFNCGAAALKYSSLLRDIKAGADNETLKRAGKILSFDLIYSRFYI